MASHSRNSVEALAGAGLAAAARLRRERCCGGADHPADVARGRRAAHHAARLRVAGEAGDDDAPMRRFPDVASVLYLDDRRAALRARKDTGMKKATVVRVRTVALKSARGSRRGEEEKELLSRDRWRCCCSSLSGAFRAATRSNASDASGVDEGEASS